MVSRMIRIMRLNDGDETGWVARGLMPFSRALGIRFLLLLLLEVEYVRGRRCLI